MNAQEILTDWLNAKGYDGLVLDSDRHCEGCSIDDLMCDAATPECRPAKTEEIEEKERNANA